MTENDADHPLRDDLFLVLASMVAASREGPGADHLRGDRWPSESLAALADRDLVAESGTNREGGKFWRVTNLGFDAYERV
ncbi:MAG: hypothetical protein ABI577_16565, partial [bacterium]